MRFHNQAGVTGRTSHHQSSMNQNHCSFQIVIERIVVLYKEEINLFFVHFKKLEPQQTILNFSLRGLY